MQTREGFHKILEFKQFKLGSVFSYQIREPKKCLIWQLTKRRRYELDRNKLHFKLVKIISFLRHLVKKKFNIPFRNPPVSKIIVKSFIRNFEGSDEDFIRNASKIQIENTDAKCFYLKFDNKLWKFSSIEHGDSKNCELALKFILASTPAWHPDQNSE